MSRTMLWRRVLSRLSNTRKCIARNITIWRKSRHRGNSSWRKSTTRNACILHSAIVRHASSRSLCRFRRLEEVEQWHETNTQCVGEEELLVPKCGASSSPDRHAGEEHVDFRGERMVVTWAGEMCMASNFLASHRSTMLQSGSAKRSRICQCCIQR